MSARHLLEYVFSCRLINVHSKLSNICLFFVFKDVFNNLVVAVILLGIEVKTYYFMFWFVLFLVWFEKRFIISYIIFELSSNSIGLAGYIGLFFFKHGVLIQERVVNKVAGA